MERRDWLTREIERFVAESPGNRMDDGRSYFDAPLVGYAAAADPLFRDYQRIIGPFHWTPLEFLAAELGLEGAAAGTVISWVMPITVRTREENRTEDTYPCRAWAHTRTYGDEFISQLRRHVVDLLRAHGAQAAAPFLSERWRTLADTPVGLASNWSERRAAYAAGLGTFSLNDGLITPRGIAHRLGSVVTDLVLPPTERPPWRDHRENCLQFAGRECGVCIDRCPVGAITLDGHDKARCRRHTYGEPMRAKAAEFGAEIPGCGLCQTKVPCEFRVPRR